MEEANELYKARGQLPAKPESELNHWNKWTS